MVPTWIERSYLSVQAMLERPLLSMQAKRIAGPLQLDRDVYRTFVNGPWDVLPDFQGPASRRLRLGRGMDHPRYGRFIYAFARVYRPELVVEVGSYAGGTAVAWATALKENGRGRLICVDNDTYSQGTYPTVTRANLARTGLPAARYELRCGDSKVVVPQVVDAVRGMVDAYLVDADHTYEGAVADMENGLPMLKRGGFMLVHDIDPNIRLLERTSEHPHPVHEAMFDVVTRHSLEFCVVKCVRRHLGIIRV